MSFDHWIFKLQVAKKLYLEEALQQGIIQSLKRNVANTICFIGPDVGVDSILAKVQDKYGQVASSDVLFPNFYQMSHEKGEKIHMFLSQVEGSLNQL